MKKWWRWKTRRKSPEYFAQMCYYLLAVSIEDKEVFLDCEKLSVCVFVICESKIENSLSFSVSLSSLCVGVGVKKVSAMWLPLWVTDWIRVRFTRLGRACAFPAEAVSFSISLASLCLVSEAIRKIRPAWFTPARLWASYGSPLFSLILSSDGWRADHSFLITCGERLSIRPAQTPPPRPQHKLSFILTAVANTSLLSCAFFLFSSLVESISLYLTHSLRLTGCTNISEICRPQGCVIYDRDPDTKNTSAALTEEMEWGEECVNHWPRQTYNKAMEFDLHRWIHMYLMFSFSKFSLAEALSLLYTFASEDSDLLAHDQHFRKFCGFLWITLPDFPFREQTLVREFPQEYTYIPEGWNVPIKSYIIRR